MHPPNVVATEKHGISGDTIHLWCVTNGHDPIYWQGNNDTTRREYWQVTLINEEDREMVGTVENTRTTIT